MSRTPRARGTDARAVNTLREYVARLETTIPSAGLTAADVQSLIDASIAAIETPATDESETTFEQGDYTYDGSDYFFVSFGEDGDWVAFRHYITSASAEDTLSGSGTKPTSLPEFQALAWPTPAP